MRQVILLLLAVVCFSEITCGPIVTTKLGKVEGWERKSRDGRVYQGWTKIPYAQPPVAKLRFQAPKPPHKWNGVLNATLDVPPCMQIERDYSPVISDAKMSEDCLYVNVYRPKDESLRQMPVLFYIHGGSFSHASVGGYRNAEYLMDEDVVLVEVSYRLNGFGFMSLGDDVIPGNFGQKDQVQALVWVKDNIEAFGGDPSKVTVFGESSGAVSSHFLLKSPLSEDLVAGAVSHSGAINHVSHMLNTDFVIRNSLKVVNSVDCYEDSSEKILACLQTVDAAKLMKAIDAVADMSKDPVQFYFTPIIEVKKGPGAFATEDLSLRPSKKPWIETVTNGEYIFYEITSKLSPSYVESAFKNLPEYLDGWVRKHVQDEARVKLGAAILQNLYFPPNLSLQNFTKQLAKMHADNNFIFTFLYDAKNHVGPKWLSQLEIRTSIFDSSAADGVAMHASASKFYFKQMKPASDPAGYRAASKRLIKYLVNFATYGNPTPPKSPVNWPAFETNEIFRMTEAGDYVGNQLFFDGFVNTRNAWNVVIGWK